MVLGTVTSAAVAMAWLGLPLVAVAADRPKNEAITEAEVNAAQQAWCDGLLQIGKVHQDGGDYKAAARRITKRHGSRVMGGSGAAMPSVFRRGLSE